MIAARITVKAITTAVLAYTDLNGHQVIFFSSLL